jgi:GxxExxY protein
MESKGNNVSCASEYYQDIFDKHLDDTENIIRKHINQIVHEVYDTLGSGHSERVYHNAMEVSLRGLNIPYESERHVPIYYKDHVVGMARADIIIGRTTVLELKSVKTLNDIMIAQARKYLHQLKINIGYLINFPSGENCKAEIVEIRL